MELERRRQLEDLEEISRQDARLSAAARSMARHRIKAAKLEETRTAKADNDDSGNAASAAVGGGEGSSMSLATRHDHHRRRRKDSSSGVHGSNVNQDVGRHRRQFFQGGASCP